jgi:hypothetical protein
MSDITEGKDAIIVRIERLERQNRRVKSGILVALFALASVGLMGQTTTQHKATKPATHPAASAAATPSTPPTLPKNIEAESFVLKDSNGKTRAELSMGGTGPSFRLLDPNGSALVTLSLNDSSPSGPFVLLSDPAHHAGVSMSVIEHAGSQLTLTGERPDIQAHLGVGPDGTALALIDQDGFSTNIGNGSQQAKNGQVKKTTAASITLFNKDRKVLWTQP